MRPLLNLPPIFQPPEVGGLLQCSAMGERVFRANHSLMEFVGWYHPAVR